MYGLTHANHQQSHLFLTQYYFFGTDPCLYIMRFANKMELGEKTHEVSMTAQRLVQRMMKDSIHSGRRPSGLCGAALLIAARMHDYSRTPMDIVRIVKIHESTLRKRLIEFGDTPSSMLTLDEFMAVDLEAEQDPPAFKAARKRDRERLQKLSEHHEAEFSDLQMEIDSHLEKELKNKRKRRFDPLDAVEHDETDVFIRESTLDVINECLADAEDVDDPGDVSEGGGKKDRIMPTGLKPDLAALCLPNLKDDASETNQNQDINFDGCELDLEGLDDEEINGYIMTEAEAKYKDVMWNRLNAEYLKEAKAKEEKLAKEKEEGKPEKKRRRNSRKKNIGPSNTAGEAIEKMLQEKKISNKINYDILKTLTEPKSVELETTNVTSDMTNEIPLAIDEKATNSLLGRFVDLFIFRWTSNSNFFFADLKSLKTNKNLMLPYHGKQKLLQWGCQWLQLLRQVRKLLKQLLLRTVGH